MFILFLGIIYEPSYGQDYLGFTKESFKEYCSIEDSLGSTKLSHCVERILNGICPPSDTISIANPVAFRRKSSSLLPLTVEYYFRNSDSSICCIFYCWEKTYDWGLDTSSRFHRHDKMTLKDYNKVFDALNAQCTSLLGIPTKTNKKIITTKFFPNHKVYSRVSWWKLKNKTIHLKMICDDVKTKICTRSISAHVEFH
jgi:hypothetical protein